MNRAKYSAISSGLASGSSLLKVDDFDIPDDLRYTREHEWVVLGAEKCRVGVTDYAQESLHEVVYVDLPAVGKILKRGEVFGTVESVKAVSELYSPVAGQVVERNEKLVQSPELVNQDPYGGGWIVVVKPSQLQVDAEALLTAQSYADYLKELTRKK